MNDQVTASTRPRAADARLALRVRSCSSGEHRLARRSPTLGSGVERDAVDAGDADDLLDEIGLAVDVRPPGRRRDLDAAPLPATMKPSVVAARASSRADRQVEPGQALHLGSGSRSRRSPAISSPATTISDGLAAAELEHHLRGELEARHA